MSIYQRCLSKSLIFFSILFIVFLLLIESNIGFKWIFNFTSRFFVGFKAEDISGNWRDFTLKNINYNVCGISIKANSIHLILDTKSLFTMSTIFKEIETKNLIISLKKNISTNILKKNISTNILKKNISTNILKKNIFIKNPIIFQKIHADRILFKTPKIDIFFFNILSGIKFKNHDIIFFSTYVNTINIVSPNINFEKKNITKTFNLIKNVNNTQKIYNFLYFFSHHPKIFIPLNLNLTYFKCTKINFLDYKNADLFQIEFKAKLEKNILHIKKIQVDTSHLKIKSYGKVIFNKDDSISCIINNTISIPRFHNRNIKFLFKANLNKKLTFKLTSNNLYKINVHGVIFLNILNYPFYIKLNSKNLFWSIKKDYILKINRLNGILKGKINNYSLSLINILSIQGMPSIFIKINGCGNLQNVFLKNIQFLPIKKTKIYEKNIHLEKNIKYNQYILKLIGKIDVLGKSNNNTYNLCIPKINLNGNLMKKQVSILGSLYYKKFNLLEIPGINVLAGNNELYLKGSLGKKYSIYSSIYADDLDYFLPHLQGSVKAEVNFNGDYIFPTMTSKISASRLNWNSIYLKSVKILTNMNINNKFSGNISINTKKIRFSNVNINSLNIKTHWNNYKQDFCVLLKSHELYINFIINGIYDHKTGGWYGFFKKINIKTFWGHITAKKRSLIYYYDPNNSINNFYEKNIKIRDVFSSFLYQTKQNFFNLFHKSLISFKSQLSIDAKLQTILGEKISNGKIVLTANNIKLEQKIEQKVFLENLEYLKLSVDLIKDNFQSKWIINKLTNSLEKQNVFGHLNIIDIYNKKNIEGKFTITNFPISFVNFFTTNFKEIKGTFESNIKFFGTLYQPKVSADVSVKNIFIRSDNILKYIALFFPYFLDKTDSIKINQEITMKKGNVLFTLDSFCKNSNNIIEWNLLFNSKKIAIVVFPKIKVKFSSRLNLHYLLERYDLIGYIKFSWFYFKINERNFIF